MPKFEFFSCSYHSTRYINRMYHRILYYDEASKLKYIIFHKIKMESSVGILSHNHFITSYISNQTLESSSVRIHFWNHLHHEPNETLLSSYGDSIIWNGKNFNLTSTRLNLAFEDKTIPSGGGIILSFCGTQEKHGPPHPNINCNSTWEGY